MPIEDECALLVGFNAVTVIFCPVTSISFTFSHPEYRIPIATYPDASDTPAKFELNVAVPPALTEIADMFTMNIFNI